MLNNDGMCTRAKQPGPKPKLRVRENRMCTRTKRVWPRTEIKEDVKAKNAQPQDISTACGQVVEPRVPAVTKVTWGANANTYTAEPEWTEETKETVEMR